MYYTANKPLKQGFIHTTTPYNCDIGRRCHNYKKCKTCHTIYYNRQFKKSVNHLDENVIRSFKYKQYIVFTSRITHKNYTPDMKNADLQNFLRELTTTKRYKSSPIHNAEYIAIKEISHDQELGFNPHYNFIYLSNDKPFTQSAKFKEIASKYSIKAKAKDIYKTDFSYLASIKKIINYSLKFSKDRLNLELTTNITKAQRDILKSSLFDPKKYVNSHKRLYKYISDINAHYDHKAVQARKVYKTYITTKKMKPHTKVMMLRSLYNKLDKIEKARKYFKAVVKRRLNHSDFNLYTHYTHLIHKN